MHYQLTVILDETSETLMEAKLVRRPVPRFQESIKLEAGGPTYEVTDIVHPLQLEASVVVYVREISA